MKAFLIARFLLIFRTDTSGIGHWWAVSRPSPLILLPAGPLLPVPAGGTAATSNGHPATTPCDVAAWWCKYLLPQEGVLLDCFCGPGTMLAAALDFGASRVVGIEKEKKYLDIAKKRIARV
jgi:DNA modification methylase